MAFHWRIRHKLMLGLGLVVAILTFLLAGTLYGVESFRATMKSIESKQYELAKAQALKEVISELKSKHHEAEIDGKKWPVFLAQIPEAGKALQAYEDQLNDTLKRGRDPDKGVQEKGLVDFLHKNVEELERQANANPFKVDAENREDSPLQKLMEDLLRTCDDLGSGINTELYHRSRDAHETFRVTLWIVCSGGTGGILLLCVFMRFFYRWVFSPIRDLQQGAGRVAHGDFEHRIEVHSGDEMEDLAEAFNDMTGRLREMYRDLARQVNERSRQLVRSERLAGIGFLAAGVAHEINNPLASIAFCSEALQDRLADVLALSPDNGEVVTRYLTMIQQEAFRCKEITQKLLEFSRGGERRREPTDLAELIGTVLDMVQHLPNSRGKTIRFQPSGRLVAWVNAQEIKSVVLNLVVNALDSMDEGGTLAIALGQRDHMAELVFTDTGCGMSPEILENIFEPFFTRSRTGKGTGLGLSISHRIISQHSGEIEAASAGLDRGSVFTVRLPLQPPEAGKEETPARLAA